LRESDLTEGNTRFSI